LQLKPSLNFPAEITVGSSQIINGIVADQNPTDSIGSRENGVV
jgi:hypothetical protein